MEQFKHLKPTNLNSVLTKDENQFQNEIKTFVSKVLQPELQNSTDSNLIIKTMLKSIGNFGLMEKIISDSPLSPLSFGLMSQEIEWLDSGCRTSFMAHACLVLFAINEYGTEEMKRKYLVGLLSGDLIGAFAVTEPDHGSDPRGIETIAKRTPDGNYAINGTKHWITNGNIADLLIIWAKTEDSPLAGFVIERDTPGISTTKIDPACMNFMDIGTVHLQNVIVSASSRLQGNGTKSSYACLNISRFGVSWGVLGAARACIEAALKSNRSYQHSILLEEVVTEYRIAILSCYHVSKLMEKGAASLVMISILKRSSCKTALNIARSVMEICGVEKLPQVVRHCHNLEAVNTYEGTEDIHALILGRAVTELQAFF